MLKKTTISLIISVAVAAPGYAHHKEGHSGGENDKSEVIEYEFDEFCNVTLTSNRTIRNIAILNDEGETVKEWGMLRDKSFSSFGMYAMNLTKGSLYVSTNNGGIGTEVGQTFRDEFAACLVPDCPFEDEFNQALEGSARIPTTINFSNSCTTFVADPQGGTQKIFMIVDQRDFEGEFLYNTPTENGVEISFREAIACIDLIECDNRFE